ncbi:MAG: hypothetical protein PHH94_03525 [Sphaerochaetaceae bacterium]|nr:hypothetical protein [Sphaerochaetaceae bacterium]
MRDRMAAEGFSVFLTAAAEGLTALFDAEELVFFDVEAMPFFGELDDAFVLELDDVFFEALTFFEEEAPEGFICEEGSDILVLLCQRLDRLLLKTAGFDVLLF